MKAIDNLLLWVQTTHHPIYEKYLIDLYEEEHGSHFDECLARKTVDSMFHTEEDNRVVGEHWTIEQVKEATEMYNSFLRKNDTCWDLYVAVHMWWHDLGRNYARRGQESELIEDAVVWAFMDEDAPEGKIWRYIHAMK